MINNSVKYAKSKAERDINLSVDLNQLICFKIPYFFNATLPMQKAASQCVCKVLIWFKLAEEIQELLRYISWEAPFRQKLTFSFKKLEKLETTISSIDSIMEIFHKSTNIVFKTRVERNKFNWKLHAFIQPYCNSNIFVGTSP